jgi:hypothetical protein
MRRAIVLLSAGLTFLSAAAVSAQNDPPRNLILFVPDGLRARIVTPQTAPAMAEVRDKGVNFKNPHSLFPTFTMANGSAMATGHYLGDTGTFSNTIYTGYPVAHANGTVVPFLEVNPVMLDIDEHFGGDYLNEETILKMARGQGYSTAAIGKHGPTFLFDHTDKTGADGLHSIVIDDATGGKNGVPLSQEMQAALAKADLPLATPPAAKTARPATPRRLAPPPPTLRNRPTWPTSPPKWCCRCSRRATSRLCWCSGRAIPTAVSTIPATVSTPSRRASMGRPRLPASGTPTIISRSCARHSTISVSQPPPTS